VSWCTILLGLFAEVHITNRFTKFIRVVLVLIVVGLFLGFGRKVQYLSHVPTYRGLPLNVLISTADAGTGEVDYWIHRFLSRLGRSIDVQVVDTRNLRIVDDSIILSINDLTKWTDLTMRSGFKNVGLLRIGEFISTSVIMAPLYLCDRRRRIWEGCRLQALLLCIPAILV
jgi:hypothetical protein